MANFDPYAWTDFFFGSMEREEAVKILRSCEVGSFLLRESKSRPNGYSLSVREAAEGDHQTYHYFIEKKETDEGKVRYEMGGHTFVDIPSLINHYKMHILEKSCLVTPVPKQPMHRVVGKYKFDGERVTDLPFERGETLEIISKPEEKWWTARNALGMTGLVPANYIRIVDDTDDALSVDLSSESSGATPEKRFSTNTVLSDVSENRLSQEPEKPKIRQVPAWVRVITARRPNIYDTDALTLTKGELLLLEEVLPTGMCRGLKKDSDKSGFFPATYVEWTNIPLRAGLGQ
ncbi:variant SH3 domain-containing protein [Aphelenchoides avenae]|nr:variant SH3 domain-containing protein [Aphelenchus avenae]